MDALTALLRPGARPPQLGRHLLRLLVVRTAGFAALVTILLAGPGLAVDATSSPDAAPDTVPTWGRVEQAQFPGCVPAAQWPEGQFAGELVVYRYADGTVARVDFGDAWDGNHNATDVDDVEVLGMCP